MKSVLLSTGNLLALTSEETAARDWKRLIGLNKVSFSSFTEGFKNNYFISISTVVTKVTNNKTRQ